MKLKITLFVCMITIGAYQAFAQCNGADFEERNGIAILEMETKSAGGYNKESISGASGGSALTYRGSDHFGSPGNSTITYQVKINSPGTYRFLWRNKISIIASSNASTEHNDAWLKINASNFYGLDGSHRVYPGGSGKSPTAAGQTSDGWFKIYTNTVSWSWSTNTSDNDPHQIYATFNNAGVYTIQVSGRSKGHTIDRMVLYKTSSYSQSQATSLSRSQTTCTGDSDPEPEPEPDSPTPPTSPTPNKAPTVSFSNLDNGEDFTAGTTVTVGLSANDGDGSIAKYQVYVNNSLVDSDGAQYTPYKIAGIDPGNYAIRATVTDNDGATATKTVNISVASSTPEPEPEPTQPPAANKAPTIAFLNLTEGERFSSGSTVPVELAANDADGSIVKYQVFVNGKLVDTDGSRYTPHPISDIASGNYNIRATVTDDDGATASKAVKIVAGSSTPPPTPPTPPTEGNKVPTVAFSNLENGQKVTAGSTVNVGVRASDSDGSVVKHQIYVNGRLVDTDPAGFTPHPIVGIKAGSYAIKVVVTDNLGATATKTINISASSGSTPPPSSSFSFALVSSSSDASLGSLKNGMSISCLKTQNFNIRATAPSGAKSVRLSLSGAKSVTRLEELVPYSLFGDLEGNYLSGRLGSGSYTLEAVAYSGNGGSGNVVSSKTIRFTVTPVSTAKAAKVAAYAYPNPIQSDGRVAIKLPEGTTGNIEYSVTNSVGVQLEQGQFSANGSDVNLELSNVGRQVQGVYYLTLKSADSKQTIPLIKE
ncbi:MAG TPA: Ig-like domain-containing protein [Pricia sp.]|nr:Ig-like domain-containing protein [Pricia sp.]